MCRMSGDGRESVRPGECLDGYASTVTKRKGLLLLPNSGYVGRHERRWAHFPDATQRLALSTSRRGSLSYCGYTGSAPSLQQSMPVSCGTTISTSTTSKLPGSLSPPDYSETLQLRSRNREAIHSTIRELQFSQCDISWDDMILLGQLEGFYRQGHPGSSPSCAMRL
jgi:hypothetical protein